jgi:sugar phosphate isomerase/epimerase
MKFGITQGRLTNEKKGILQKFPVKWDMEFDFLNNTKLDYIELFLEKKINKNNPIWSKNGQKNLLKKLNKTNLNYYIVCDNYILGRSLDNLKLINYYKKLFKCIKSINCKLLIVPIENKNFSIKNFSKLSHFIFFLKQESKKNKIKISLEINENFNVFKKLLAIKKINDIKITFDTGNFYIKNKNVIKSLKSYYPFVNHIHLKDRSISGKNVVFGSGKIDFAGLFKFLKERKYSKFFTFETNRGNVAQETAANNLKIVKKFI